MNNLRHSIILSHREAMQKARYALLGHIDAIILENIVHERAKFDLERWVVYAAALIGFLIFVTYSRRFSAIYRDMHQ